MYPSFHYYSTFFKVYPIRNLFKRQSSRPRTSGTRYQPLCNQWYLVPVPVPLPTPVYCTGTRLKSRSMINRCAPHVYMCTQINAGQYSIQEAWTCLRSKSVLKVSTSRTEILNPSKYILPCYHRTNVFLTFVCRTSNIMLDSLYLDQVRKDDMFNT